MTPIHSAIQGAHRYVWLIRAVPLPNPSSTTANTGSGQYIRARKVVRWDARFGICSGYGVTFNYRARSCLRDLVHLPSSESSGCPDRSLGMQTTEVDAASQSSSWTLLTGSSDDSFVDREIQKEYLGTDSLSKPKYTNYIPRHTNECALVKVALSRICSCNSRPISFSERMETLPNPLGALKGLD